MAGRKTAKHTKYLAKLADSSAPCAFCKCNFDEETIYGKLYSIGDIHCHYFCALLSCCLIQKGKDEEGLFGFMYPDILAEIERSKKHKCSYCGVDGATLGCSIVQCKKQFHLPCGREKNAVSLYYGNYKSYCEKHAPKQKITDFVMEKAKSRLTRVRREKKVKSTGKKSTSVKIKEFACAEEPESVCVICYESVDGFPTTQTFWPPCCARDAWFHRTCLQRMALNAGVHYLKCPLCNDKDMFSTAVLAQGYYIPDRDAAWELEQNAFSEIYERPVECRVDDCKCSRGREYDANSGIWDIKLCVLCGSPGAHAACCATEYYVCDVCRPAAPDQSHLAVIDAVSLPSQNQNSQRTRSGPVMPSRMSIRRTKRKPNLHTSSSASQNDTINIKMEDNTVKTNTVLSRKDLNLKTPKRPSNNPTEPKQPDNELLSPLKLLKQGLNEKISSTEVEKFMFDTKLLDEMRRKFKRPKPLCVKRKIVDDILERLLDYVSIKKNVIEWKNSPEKVKESINDSTSTEDNENISESTVKTSFTIKNVSTLNRTSDTPEQNISETLENNTTIEQLNICENANLTPEKPGIMEDDSSSSPFQLPPEFIAESSNSLPIIDTPKKLKKINIQNDSMEISENNQIVNIDLVKIDTNAIQDFQIPDKKCAFKLSPLNKDIMEKNLDIDLESFKNQYLNEVDRKTNCEFGHNHIILENNPTKLRTAIDFALDAMKEPPKRKLPNSDNVASGKVKPTKLVRKKKKQCNKDHTDGKEYDNKKVNNEKSDMKDRLKRKRKHPEAHLNVNQKYTDNSGSTSGGYVKKRKYRKYKKNHNTELSIRNRNIKLKIRFQSQELNVKISKPKKRGRQIKNNTAKVMKQYVLQYAVNQKSPKDCIIRPDAEVTPIKKKYLKTEKPSDNLKQTSIATFFKISPKM